MNLNQDAYSDRSVRMFQAIFQLAAKLEHGFIGSEHIVWGIAGEEWGLAANVLGQHGVEAGLIEEYIRQYDNDAAAYGGSRAIQFSGDLKNVMELAEEQQKDWAHDKMEPEHMLLGILAEKECAAFRMLQSLDVDTDQLLVELIAGMRSAQNASATGNTERKPQRKPASKTLDTFSRNLTADALAGRLDPMIGWENEVERMVQILSRRQKNNPVLIGEPGVGKTAVVEGLAQRMAQGRTPKNLSGKRILTLDLAGMLAGARYRGDFEERIKELIEEAKGAGDVILFLDELHTLIGTGAGSGDGAMDAANILKPVLGRGELQIIGATTIKEYRRFVEKDSALERRFQPVMVEEPSTEDTIRILTGLRGQYERFHELTITDKAMEAAAELSYRYIQDRFLPDKAIDLLDEAAARIRTRSITMPPHLRELDEEIQAVQAQKKQAVQAQDYETAAVLRDRQKTLGSELAEKQAGWQRDQGGRVEAADIAEVVSAWTKIPVTMLTEGENQRLLKLEEELHKRVVGQDEAVTAIARAIRRGRTGVAEPNRPMGSFLFLGPTGVGKTEVCRALAAVLFQDESAMIRLDMSEYMERHTVSKLIGSPPGYVGYDEGGQLTEKVRRKPYSIVLFDEIEKAHPDVWNALLQIMDDGRLTDAQGRTVNFRNTVVVMTSNIGARDILGRSSLGFKAADNEETRSVAELRGRVMDEVKKTFQPEFLNRIDETIVFHQLEREHILAIARGLADRFTERLARRDIRLVVEDSAVSVLAEKGFEPAYGARPLHRVIQSVLENAVAEKLLQESPSPGDTLVASGKAGAIALAVRKRRSVRKEVPV